MTTPDAVSKPSEDEPADEPSDAAQSSAAPTAVPHRRRRRVRLALIVAVILVILPIVDYGLLAHRSPRIDISFPSSEVPGHTWVIVGLDDRAEAADVNNGDFGTGATKPTGGRADLIVVVRPGVGAITIPRDLVVFDKRQPTWKPSVLTNSWQTSPQQFVDTLCFGLGIAATGVLAVDMRGFQTMVDQLGGIEVTIPEPRRDRRAGLNLSAGTQTIDGRTALALVRSRQGEVQRGGTWIADPEGQAGREARAGQVLALVVAKAKEKALTNPVLAHQLAWTVLPDVRRDTDNSLWSLTSLRGVSVDHSLAVHRLGPTGAEVSDQTAPSLAQIGITGGCTTAG